MKKITILSVLLLTLFAIGQSFSQKVVVVGMNHTTPDGFSFVVTQALGASEVVYFSEDEYNNATNVFSSGESVVQYTADVAGLAVGQVVFVKETSTNTFTVTCTNGGTCGSATATSIPFSIGSGGEHMYAYSDTDSDPTNGVTEIYSLFYTFNTALPAGEDPTPDYPNAVVISGFTSATPNRTEYMFSPATVRDGVSQTNLENPGNYLNGSANADLSLVEFTNLNLAGTNPVLTVTSSPASVLENSGTGIVYTFTLDAPAVGAITANFSVGGTATFATDYTQTGALTFTPTMGTVVIPNAGTMATVTLTPVGDTDLEADETAILSIMAGTGYDAGVPSSATGTFDNDDTLGITPVVAVTGANHTGTDGFSFVALDDIPATTTVYFTENAFDGSLLTFVGAEAVVSWISPGSIIPRGEVIVAMETGANTFTVTCSSGTCGTIAVVSGTFSFASDGEAFFAYTDSDTDHTNGITEISAVLYTGVSGTPGGNIPASEDPSTLYIGSVVVDGFPATPPSLTEYDPALRGVTVDQANFQNTTNWVHAQPSATLSTVPFANIIIATGSTNPIATLTVAPTSVVEDSGTGMLYTFMLDAPAVGTITVNFTVGGTATFTTDYTQTGAATFTATTGSVDILNGNNSATVTVTPVIDTDVETAETVELMLASGTGYDGGSPNAATGTITNDDTSSSDPLVAITGISHAGPDGFSFVAAQDIPAGAVIYFTEDEFDNTTLKFSAGEAVLQYTSPGAVIPAGDVIVISETAPDTFSLTCNGASGAACGSIAVIVGGFAPATDGETLYAYEDSDTDPTNGVDDIYAVMFTGVAGSPGGPIPAVEDPSGIYLSALVVDGFPAAAPVKTEYDPAGRGILVTMADFENVANWVHGQPNPPDLSPVPFALLSIVDVTPPVITCPLNATVECGGDTTPTGTGTATAIDNIDPTPTITFADTSVAGCGLTEVITRTWTATDDVGNSSSCVQTITVVDTTPPIVSCPTDVTVECGDPTDPGSTGTATGTDGCGTVAITFTDSSSAGCGLTEIITRTWTATDECGFTSTCDQIITVVDTTAPIVSCPTDVTVECGDPTDPGSTGTATGTDGCGTVAITFTDSSAAGCGLTETITRTWTATDECGFTSTCDQIITVVDTTAPIVSCPTDVTVECGDPTDPGSTGTATGTDGCGTVAITFTDSSSAGCGLTEIITRTWTVTDECGITSTCDQIITVVDTTAPIVSCPTDVTVECGDPTDPGSTGTATGTDGCGTVAITFTDSSAAGCGLTEIITRTWTATDECGITASCDQIITVVDTTAPIVSCPADVTVECGDPTDPGSTGTATGTDGCGTVAITFTDSSSAGCGLTEIITRTWIVTDECGITSTCDQIITVVDTTAPIVSCPTDVTVECGDPTDPGSTGTATGTDGCGTVAITFTDSSSAGCGLTEIITRTWTATDECGFTSTCDQIITVVDTTAPIVSCPTDVTVECGDPTDPGSTGTATGTDGCGTVAITFTDSSTTGCGLTETITRTWTATDECGFTSTCDQIITVVDTTAPIVSCPTDVTVECGDPTDPGSTGTATGTDGCGTVAITFTDSSSAGCGLTETITRTWTATDECGIIASCDQIITVVDTTAPIVSCPTDVTVECGDPTDPGSTGTATGTDGCGTVAITFTDSSAAGCGLTETITRTWTATDECGFTSTCDQIITVVDTTPPTIVCPADIVITSIPGECNGPVVLVDPTVSDTCGGVSFSNDAPAVFPFGVTNVTWTATDDCGNTATCVQTVTVNSINTITTLTVVPALQQYSDEVTFEATIDPGNCPGAGLAATNVEFFVGTQSMGTVNMVVNGENLVGTLTTALLEIPSDPFDASHELGPGLKTVTAEFQGVSPNYNVSNPPAINLEITQEDAIAEYTGLMLQATAPNSTEAEVMLSFNIQDITCTDPGDPDPGDIRNATVQIVLINGGTNNIGPLFNNTDGDASTDIVLVNPGDTKTGTVSFPYTFDIGNSASESFTVGVVIDGYYVGSTETVITVYEPVGDFITGGGYIIPDDSAGQYASTDGLNTNFGFNVKYNRNGRRLKGHMNIIFRRIESGVLHVYQIKGNAIQSLGVDISDPDNKIAQFITKANLKDITDPDNPVSLGGNLRLKADMTDRGEPGTDDSIGLTLTTSSGVLLYSSNWTGIDTTEMLLSGGNIVVHSGFSTENILGDPSFDISTVVLHPVPAKDYIIVANPQGIPLGKMTINDLNGRLIKTIDLTNMGVEKVIDISALETAPYMVIINSDQGRLVKQIIKKD